ncbi:MAG TPA: nucleotidyltransferase family protein [Steroidobacteraceae bacterium]|nr:nucleotidyltransferase family protein [Steroidobacteraceae bacterium]
MSQRAEVPSLHAVVLAAGGSTRFGSPKQLIRVQGRPLLHRAVANAVQVAGQGVTVVLGSHAAELAPLLRHSSASVIINRAWSEGIASSIRAAVARLPASCEGVLLTLADQAAVTADDLARLAATWRAQPEYIVAARYEATVGVPALFPRAHFADLAALRGDRGARDLLRRHADRTVAIALANASIDIDTPEDLLRLS